MIKKFLLFLIGLVLILIVGTLGFLTHAGAWGVFFPSSHHDEIAPDLPVDLKRPAILIFTKTNGFRHKDGIAAGSAAMKDIAKRRGWDIFHTENGAIFNDVDLANFEAIVFHNATGDMLSEAQETAFQTWLEAGGGWFGTHSMGDGSHASWQWYMDNLLGAKFTSHTMGPQLQSANVIIQRPDHPIMAGLPESFSHIDEWYSWESSPEPHGFNILATLDENSYEPYQRIFGSEIDLRMGVHPIIWTNCIANGRAVYSALGHTAEAYEAPEHLKILENAMAWAVGESEDCEPNP